MQISRRTSHSPNWPDTPKQAINYTQLRHTIHGCLFSWFENKAALDRHRAERGSHDTAMQLETSEKNILMENVKVRNLRKTDGRSWPGALSNQLVRRLRIGDGRGPVLSREILFAKLCDGAS